MWIPKRVKSKVFVPTKDNEQGGKWEHLHTRADENEPAFRSSGCCVLVMHLQRTVKTLNCDKV